MGPKAKPKQMEWEMCNSCNRFVPAVDSAKHVANGCHGNSTSPPHLDSSPRSSLVTVPSSHGFIKDGILHGFAKERHTRGEELSRIPASSIDDVVLVCPSTMALCELVIGSPVLVWRSASQFAIQTAWPAKDGIRQTEIGVSARTLKLLSSKTGSVLHVQKVSSDQQSPASEVVLQTSLTSEEKPFFGSRSFEEFFRYTYESKLVILGCPLVMQFYGQECMLTVIEVNQINLNTRKEARVLQTTESELSQEPICENFSNLSLNSEVEDFNPNTNDTSTCLLQSPISELSSKNRKRTSTPKCKPSASICQCHRTRPFTASASFVINSRTKIRIVSSNGVWTEEKKHARVKNYVTFDDIGGLHKQVQELQKLLFMSEQDLRLFSSYGLQLPKGILLFGPPGTGKTLIGKAIANQMGDKFVPISLPEIYSKFVGETESKLQEIFLDAINRAPSVIFIEEIDTLCFKRSNMTTHQEERIISAFLMSMDNLPNDPQCRVVVVATTNRVDYLTSAIRRPGRFDLEIEIGIPTMLDRADILKKLLKHVQHNLDDESIESVAFNTHGYVGADLAALCTHAGIHTIKRVNQMCNSETSNAAAENSQLFVTLADLQTAANEIKPSALREVLIEVPKVYWHDIGGLDDLKRKLKQAVEWPLKHPDSFERMGIKPPKGVLMYGPPGCSKTMIAKAVATESGLNFIAIKGPELFSKWVGESERAVREVFRKARAASPSVVFFDEIDALASERGTSSGSSQVGDRVLAQLLSEIDGLENLQGVTVLAATNRPDMIDKALLRPGRLDRIVYVPLPDKETRKAIFHIQFRHIPSASNVSVDDLADKTNSYSGAEVVAVCQEAALAAMEECLEATLVWPRHFEHALQLVRPRISQEMIKFYDDYHAQGQQKL